MIVTASTSCIPDEPLVEILDQLVNLEYTAAELVIGTPGVILPTEIEEKHESVVQIRKSLRRIVPIAIYFDVDTPPDDPNDSQYIEYVKCFTQACQLAKECKVAVITIHAAPLGTSFNGEVDRLKELVKIGIHHGVVVGVMTEIGRLTDTPETALSLCKFVKGLGITLDPSQYIYGCQKQKDYKPILPYVCHVRLRDSSQEHFQTRVGQGIVDFGRLVDLLKNEQYQRGLCVDIVPVPNIDQWGELRKMRLLLECTL